MGRTHTIYGEVIALDFARLLSGAKAGCAVRRTVYVSKFGEDTFYVQAVRPSSKGKPFAVVTQDSIQRL